MKAYRVALALAALSLAPPAIAEGAADAMERIGAAFAHGDDWPADQHLYAERITVGHQFDQPLTVPSALANQAIQKEAANIRQHLPHYQRTLVRQVAGKDTLVIVLRTTGTMPDGTPLQVDAATFFTFENGRVRDIQTWEDRKQTERLQEAIAPSARR